MRPRVPGAIVVILLMGTSAFAQHGRATSTTPVATLPPSAPAPLTHPSPLPPIFHPLPPVVHPLPSGSFDLFRAPPDTYTPHPGSAPTPGGFVGYVPWGPWPGTTVGDDRDALSSGFLALQVQPTSTQVYVDGLYVGTVNDVRGLVRGQPLAPGAHRVELRAPGYEESAVDVRIDPGRTTLYRAELTPARIAAAPPRPAAVAAAHPKTFYVIPGCYAGDKRPEPGHLPRGCDASKVRAVPPVVTRVDAPPHS